MQWERHMVKHSVNGLESFNMFYTRHNGLLINVLEAGGGVSYSLSQNELNHLVIGMYRNYGMGDLNHLAVEPTYSQKLRIIQELGRWKEVALEVMPPESEVVDVEEVYHIWEFQYIYSFFINVGPIFTEPSNYENNFAGVDYHLERQNGAIYAYFKDREHMTWRKKQALKNHITIPENTAVEIICEAMESTNHGCMIILPPFECLDFGLIRPTY